MSTLQPEQRVFTCAFTRKQLTNDTRKVQIVDLSDDSYQLYVEEKAFFHWILSLPEIKEAPGLLAIRLANNVHWTFTLQNIGSPLSPMWHELILSLIKMLEEPKKSSILPDLPQDRTTNPAETTTSA